MIKQDKIKDVYVTQNQSNQESFSKVSSEIFKKGQPNQIYSKYNEEDNNIKIAAINPIFYN